MSVQTEIELDIQQAPESSIGLDIGVSKFVTYSTLEYDGFFKPINSYRSYETRLAKKQRKLSRKTKFSNNWKQQTLKIQKLHSKIANSRKDYLHNISNEISKNHARLYIKDLQI
jgi:putative transposase